MEENLTNREPETEDPYLMGTLSLAYIGDAVFELMVREYMLSNSSKQVNRLHKHTTSAVNAAAQSAMIGNIMDKLNEKEIAVFKRGRNHAAFSSAKHQKITDYRRATGLEAVFGYLYLSKQFNRLSELFKLCMENLKTI